MPCSPDWPFGEEDKWQLAALLVYAGRQRRAWGRHEEPRELALDAVLWAKESWQPESYQLYLKSTSSTAPLSCEDWRFRRCRNRIRTICRARALGEDDLEPAGDDIGSVEEDEPVRFDTDPVELRNVLLAYAEGLRYSSLADMLYAALRGSEDLERWKAGTSDATYYRTIAISQWWHHVNFTDHGLSVALGLARRAGDLDATMVLLTWARGFVAYRDALRESGLSETDFLAAVKRILPRPDGKQPYDPRIVPRPKKI